MDLSKYRQLYVSETQENLEKLSVLLVEQSAKLALQVTEDVLVLSRGRIIHSGKSAELLAQPERLAELIVAH